MNAFRMQLFAEEGVAGVLRDSRMPDGLLNTVNGTLVRYVPSKVPVAMVSHEAVLVHDTGTGRILTIGLHENYADRELIDAVLSPIVDLGLVEPKMARSYGSDYAASTKSASLDFHVLAARWTIH